MPFVVHRLGVVGLGVVGLGGGKTRFVVEVCSVCVGQNCLLFRRYTIGTNLEKRLKRHHGVTVGLGRLAHHGDENLLPTKQEAVVGVSFMCIGLAPKKRGKWQSR